MLPEWQADTGSSEALEYILIIDYQTFKKLGRRMSNFAFNANSTYTDNS
jgi:hypothetical protein